MRGYGRSSAYTRHEDYALEHSMRDTIKLRDSTGLGKDAEVLIEADLSHYVAALERTGFFGLDPWYRNAAHKAKTISGFRRKTGLLEQLPFASEHAHG
jgi:hypothetical protein